MSSVHLEHLKSLVDEKGLITEDKAAYDTGARGDTGTSLCVLRPTTSDQVSKIVSYCAKNNLHIIPQSGNTGLVGGSIADESGNQVLLNLERMNTIHEIDPANLSIHTDAGVRLSAANSALEKFGLQIPIDLGSDPCLGGMTSTNTGGSRYLKYRGMREHIMGVKVVLADEDGTILNLLTPLHKNNTGLDAKQLFIGTCGQLGIITEVIVRLAPILQQRASALLIPASLDTVNDLLLEIEKRCGTYLSAFEGMSGNSMQCALDHCPSLQSPFGTEGVPDYAILLELSRSWPSREGEQGLNEVLENALAELWERESPLLENALIGDGEKLWSLRHSISEGVQKSGKLYAFDISVKRSEIMRFRAHIAENMPAEFKGLRLCDFGHVGDGALHSALILDRDDPRASDPAFETALREWVNDQVVFEFGGSYSAEHALGRKVQDAYTKYTAEEVKTLTRAIKTSIAPARIGTIKL